MDDMKERVRAAAEAALTAMPDGLTGEALTGMVAKQVKRQLPMGQVVSALRERPQRFVEDEGGRWRLRTQEVLLLPDDALDTLSSDDAASTTRNLTRGSYVIFDLEATHQDATSPATEIIQIAAQRFEHGILCSTWDSFAQPLVPIPEHIIQLTHISNEDVVNAPSLADVLREFFERFGDLPLIAHNGASYDGPLLRATCERLNLPLPETFLVLDTLPLARLLLPCEALHTVSTLAQRYGCLREDAHRADADVEMLAGIVRGLEAEFQRGADGAAAYNLLRRARDLWVALLTPPAQAATFPDILATFGANITPLCPNALRRHRGRSMPPVSMRPLHRHNNWDAHAAMLSWRWHTLPPRRCERAAMPSSKG